MNNLETLKNELINQKNILESKNYNVTVANINPSPSEITSTLNNILENVPEVSTYASYYKIFLDPATFNTPISNLIIPEGTINIRDYFAANLGTNLTGTITIPNSVQSIGIRSFAETSITDVNFSQNITEIANYGFYNCSNLNKIILPDSLTTLGAYSFQNVTECTELHISESLLKIESSTFKVLNKITSLTIPASVTNIASSNFHTVPLLENLYIKGNNTVFASSTTFTSHNPNLKIWVNFDKIASYSKTTNLTKVHDHLISEVTISQLTFPTTDVELKWFASIDDANSNVNNITTPTSVGTYYCKVA